MEYPNLDKEQEIKEIKQIKKNEHPRIWLEDISKWLPYPGTEPFPEDWAVKDIVVVSDVGAVRQGEERKTYKITNNSKRKQGAGGFLLNVGDNIIKNLNGYIIMKRKGTISDGFPILPEIKLGDNYPDEWLGKEWSIRETIWDHEFDDEKEEYYSADSTIVADPGRSEWKITNLHLSKINFRMWEEGQKVQISKSELKPITYHMENLDIPNSTIGVSFMGWAKSKF